MANTGTAAIWTALPAAVAAAALLVLVLVGVTGPAAIGLTLVTVLTAPGLAWRAVTGARVSGPLDVAVTVATSIGVTIGIGLMMNAASVSLTRRHWAEALCALVTAMTVAGIGRRTWLPPRAAPAQLRRQGTRFRSWLPPLALAALCLGIAAGGGVVAWASQQRWLQSQHFTELYARPVPSGEEVVVHNHEGRTVSYRALIYSRGALLQVRRFALPEDDSWTTEVAGRPTGSGLAASFLQVSLFLGTANTVYREIRIP